MMSEASELAEELLPTLVLNEFAEIKSTPRILQKEIKKNHSLLVAGNTLSPLEQKVLLLMLSAMSSDDSPQTKYIFRADILTKVFDCSMTNLYPTLKPLGKRLITKTHSIVKDDKQSFIYLALFSAVAYENGELTIIPNPHALPVIFDYAKKGYALVHPEVYNLKGIYNIQLYCLLCRFKSPRHDWPAFEINELKFIMGVTDGNGNPLLKKKTLVKPSVFIERVIRKSLIEIHECEAITNIKLNTDPESGEIGFRLIKAGQRVTHVIFLYSWPEHIERHLLKEIKDNNSAFDIIETLSEKRQHERLSDEEIRHLAGAYSDVGKQDASDAILDALKKRQEKLEPDPDIRKQQLLDEQNWKDVEF
jgi:hypothetical protein